METRAHVGFFYKFLWAEVHFAGPWYPLFRAQDDSAHEFQSQVGFIIALLSIAPNDPQGHLWLPGTGLEPGSPAYEANTTPLSSCGFWQMK